MDWEKLKENKWIWVIFGVVLLNIVGFAASELLVRRTTTKVIEKLQKEYSPSPYSPGIDPDKVNPDFFKKKETANPPKAIRQPEPSWEDTWEKQRS